MNTHFMSNKWPMYVTKISHLSVQTGTSSSWESFLQSQGRCSLSHPHSLSKTLQAIWQESPYLAITKYIHASILCSFSTVNWVKTLSFLLKEELRHESFISQTHSRDVSNSTCICRACFTQSSQAPSLGKWDVNPHPHPDSSQQSQLVSE